MFFYLFRRRDASVFCPPADYEQPSRTQVFSLASTMPPKAISDITSWTQGKRDLLMNRQ
jgi:hypothetical protein